MKKFNFLMASTFLGLISISSTFFCSMAHAQGNSRQSIFDDLIQRYGAIKKGKVSYASFATKFNPTLHRVLQSKLREMINNRAIFNKTYSYFEVDINNDRRKDAFVQLNNSYGAGSGGAHTWVFVARNDDYELVNIFYHQVTLVVLPTKSSGFQDILVVPGKIFSPMPNNRNIFYSKCTFNPQKQWRDDSPEHYRNCQNIQRGSVISGTVIETPTFRRNPPEFSLL